jgi:hypothetical protein
MLASVHVRQCSGSSTRSIARQIGKALGGARRSLVRRSQLVGVYCESQRALG